MGGEAASAELRAAVRERAERGADIIKIMASGRALTAGTDLLACQYSLEQLRTVADEAHTRGLAVTAHAHGLPAVIQAVDAGVDGIEHCSCLTGAGSRRLRTCSSGSPRAGSSCARHWAGNPAPRSRQQWRRSIGAPG